MRDQRHLIDETESAIDDDTILDPVDWRPIIAAQLARLMIDDPFTYDLDRIQHPQRRCNAFSKFERT